SRTLLSLAGFQVIISGRFWVIAEDKLTLMRSCPAMMLDRGASTNGKRVEHCEADEEGKR
ncbi:MAG: hypothetical protein WA578_18730, partial [Candidatus Sulfotelmatobacter sp.]